MKKYALLLVMLPLATSAVHAQYLSENLVPAAVVATFKHVYPSSKEVRWEKEAANFEAGFKLKGQERSVVISPAGTLLETEILLAAAQLPAPVRATLMRDYQHYQVIEAAKIIRAASGNIVYEAEVSRAGKKQELLFHANGTKVND